MIPTTNIHQLSCPMNPKIWWHHFLQQNFQRDISTCPTYRKPLKPSKWSPRIRPFLRPGLAPSLSGGVAGAAASLQQHCQRSLGDLAPQIPSIHWKGCCFFSGETDTWFYWLMTEVSCELYFVFSWKKANFGGKKKGREFGWFLLWNWSRS